MKKILISALFTLSILTFTVPSFSQQLVSSPSFRQDFLNYINFTRTKGCNCGGTYMPPVPRLSWNYELETAAVGHAQDMANKSYFSHTSLDGRNMQERIVNAGYAYKGFRSYTVGENIAQGQMSIAEVMQGWFKSPGHCKNLMNGSFKEIGVAQYSNYWVQDFGGRESFSADEQKNIKSGRYKLIEKQ